MGSTPTTYPHNGMRTTPLCSLCACWVLTSFIGPMLLSWERLGALHPQSIQRSQGKDLSLAAPLWETHWAFLHLTAASETCQAKLLGNNSSVPYLLRRILVSGSETNIFGRTEAFSPARLGSHTVFLSPCHPVLWLMQMKSIWTQVRKISWDYQRAQNLGRGKMYLHSHHDIHQSNKQLRFP